MKLTTLTIDYQVTRSREFQSVRLGAAATVELAEGDDRGQAITRTTRWLAEHLNAQAEDILEDVLRERRAVEGI